MKNSLLNIENELRPLFEAGIAYNLMLIEYQTCIDKVDELEHHIEALESTKQQTIIDIIVKSFYPEIPLETVKDELISALGNNITKIYDCLVEIQNQCPPWPWDLLKKTTRNNFSPNILISIYFKLRKEYDKKKLSDKNFTISSEVSNFLSQLHHVKISLTNAMVSITDCGCIESFYKCRIFCHQNKTSRSQAFRIALSQVKREDPLSLVEKPVLKNKRFNKWDKKLVSLSCIASKKSNSAYLKEQLNNIPYRYQKSYQEPSILNHHNINLKSRIRSLNSFYFSNVNNYKVNNIDPITASTVIKTVMTNYAILYTFMITHSTFFIELKKFSVRVTKRIESETQLTLFLNQLHHLHNIKNAPDSWSEKLNNPMWTEIAQEEATALSSLLNYGIEIPYWGYYLPEKLIPEPIVILSEFLKLHNYCSGNLKSIKHENIENFNSKVNKNMAFMVLHLLKPFIYNTLPPAVMIKQNHPFELINRHNLSLEKKLTLALSIEQKTYTNELFIANNVMDFEDLEKLHIGLAYYYQKKFNSAPVSMNKFMSKLDVCYSKPINDNKFKMSKKFTDTILEKCKNGDYLLHT